MSDIFDLKNNEDLPKEVINELRMNEKKTIKSATIELFEQNYDKWLSVNQLLAAIYRKYKFTPSRSTVKGYVSKWIASGELLELNDTFRYNGVVTIDRVNKSDRKTLKNDLLVGVDLKSDIDELDKYADELIDEDDGEISKPSSYEGKVLLKVIRETPNLNKKDYMKVVRERDDSISERSLLREFSKLQQKGVIKARSGHNNGYYAK